MRLMLICVICSILAACAPKPTVKVIGDYCTIADRIQIRDLKSGVPTILSDGWGSHTVLTRRDAEAIGGEARKWDRNCAKKAGPK